MTDPIADMLTRIRNAITAKKEGVEIPASNEKKAIAEILLEEGWVKDVKIVEDGYNGKIAITLKYDDKKSVANFKVREGQTVGIKVTLRGERMYTFYDKFVSIALPRLRDFRGVSDKAFDGRGNYSVGLKEQLIFPEITYDQVEKIRGMDVAIVTTANTDEEARELLRALGMPFKK